MSVNFSLCRFYKNYRALFKRSIAHGLNHMKQMLLGHLQVNSANYTADHLAAK